MIRHTCKPRDDWREKVEALGLTYHSHENGPYWDESACYELTAPEVDALESAGNTLHRLCIDAAEAVIERGWWGRLEIPEAAIPTIVRSWERDDFSLYGRFDLAFDGEAPPKLLEYNADTPTALVEASVAQWFWLQELHADADQFNSIHERLIEAWRRWAGLQQAPVENAGNARLPLDSERQRQTPHPGPLPFRRGEGESSPDFLRMGSTGLPRSQPCRVYFSGVKDHPEDEQTVLYLRDTCVQAGVETCSIYVEDIGWDGWQECFVDLDGLRIERCFKLYPWEWLWHEEFGSHLAGDCVQFIEPAWKMLLSNKGLLPILWELFPEHPNLLPAFAKPEPLAGFYARKPKLSREGSNVALVEGGVVVEETTGDYGEEDCIYQALAPLRNFGRHHPVFGVWIVDHEAAGLGIREDTRRITTNLSRFIPHYFR